jgi:hypothetical protein
LVDVFYKVMRAPAFSTERFDSEAAQVLETVARGIVADLAVNFSASSEGRVLISRK